MAEDPSHRVTLLLQRIGEGQSQAAEELLPVVYDELRRLARARLARDRAGLHDPTSLVHEAYLRLVGDREYRWENRAHFFAAAAEAMRRIGVERARARGRLKRGGGQRRVTLGEEIASRDPEPEELLALDEALSRLEAREPPMAHVVKLRYFAGLTVEETAHALELSPRTVKRLWVGARAWLYDAMSRRAGERARDGAPGPGEADEESE
jgi:RNA polymerase sigma factor (TIGR02999 family)